MEEGGDAASALHRRRDFVKELTNGGRSRSELSEALEVSPATVSRATGLLKEKGLVSTRDGDVRLTVAGEVAWRSYRQMKRSLEALGEFGGPVEQFPERLDEVLLLGAEYVESEPRDRLLEILRDSRFYRAVLGSPRWEMVRFYRERAISGTDVELLATEGIIGRLVEHFGKYVEDAAESGNFTLYSLDGEVPTDLHLSTTKNGFTVVTEFQDRKRRMEAIAVSQSPEAKEWFLDYFEQLRGRSEEVSR